MVRRLGVLLYFEEKRRTFIKEVPIWEKSNLTLEEAAAYSGIGINKLRQLTDDEDCEFVLWLGTKQLIKRRKFDEYIEKLYAFLLEL
jgi:excisionase family DNA binding protein